MKRVIRAVIVYVIPALTPIVLALIIPKLTCDARYREGADLPRFWLLGVSGHIWLWMLFFAGYFIVHCMATRILDGSFRVLRMWSILIGVAVVIVALPVVVSGLSARPPGLCFLDGFRDNFTGRIEVSQMEEWIEQLSMIEGEPSTFRSLRREEILDAILGPFGETVPHGLISFDSNGAPLTVWFMAGGGFEHWGVLIAMDGSIWTSEASKRFVRWTELKDVYFFIQH